MTDIAERLARAVLDRIEADRLLNRDNVADAIRKELAVMKGPFWVPPLSPADYAPGAVPPDYSPTDPTRFTAIGGPYSGSHRTYEELTREAFLGGHYEIDIHLKHAQWIAKETPLPAPPKPKCPMT